MRHGRTTIHESDHRHRRLLRARRKRPRGCRTADKGNEIAPYFCDRNFVLSSSSPSVLTIIRRGIKLMVEPRRRHHRHMARGSRAARFVPRAARAGREPPRCRWQPCGGCGRQVGADGYTLLISFTSHTINATLYPKLPFDPVTDFKPISMIATVPSLLVGNPALPAQDLAALIALAKAKPDTLSIAIGGIGIAAFGRAQLTTTSYPGCMGVSDHPRRDAKCFLPRP